MEFVSVSPHECLVLAIRSVQAKSRSQLFRSCISARIVTHDRIGHCLLVLCKAAEERGFKIGILMAANKPFRQFRDAVKGEVPEEGSLTMRSVLGVPGNGPSNIAIPRVSVG